MYRTTFSGTIAELKTSDCITVEPLMPITVTFNSDNSDAAIQGVKVMVDYRFTIKKVEVFINSYHCYRWDKSGFPKNNTIDHTCQFHRNSLCTVIADTDDGMQNLLSVILQTQKFRDDDSQKTMVLLMRRCKPISKI